jgi:predicted transcriptional regulator
MPTAVTEVFVYVPLDVRDRIDVLATEVGLSRSAWCRVALIEALRRQEQAASGRDAS